MIDYIHSTTVVVSDQDAALDFYVNTLGWKKELEYPMSDNARFITVAPPGGKTQLSLAPGNWFTPERSPGGPSGISCVTSDIDETYKTLTERGVKFTGPVEMMPWGSRAVWFLDPDGNEIFVAEE